VWLVMIGDKIDENTATLKVIKDAITNETSGERTWAQSQPS
jgi:hypothetical protein